MTIIDYLLDGDPAVRRLTQVYLLDRPATFTEEGWIHEFLSRFNLQNGTWGEGIYGPKWISTFYTMRDLRSLEIDPNHPVYQRGLATIVTRLWEPKRLTDDCVVAMMVSLLVYGRYPAAGIASETARSNPKARSIRPYPCLKLTLTTKKKVIRNHWPRSENNLNGAENTCCARS